MTHRIKRHDFLGLLVGGPAGLALPSLVRAQGPKPGALLNFGYQNTSWGTIAMVAQSEKIPTPLP